MKLPVILDRRRRGIGRWALPAVVGILALLGFAGTGLGSSYTIQAMDYKFVAPGGGSSLTVGVGAQVTWVASGEGHSVTSGTPVAVDNRFADHPASAGALNRGDTFTTTFTAPGTYPYFCEFHSEQMTGVVTVVATATNPPAPTRAPTARPTAAPTAPPAAVATQVPTSPSSGVETVAPPSATPSPTTGVGGVPTAASSSPNEGGAYGPVDAVGDGTGSSGATATAVVVVLGGLALAGLVALVLRRRNRGT